MEIEYFKNERVSQSRLKKIHIHPYAYLNKGEYSELPNGKTIVGNAVDALLTMSNEEYLKLFQVAPAFTTVSGFYKVFIDNLFLSRNELSGELIGLTEDEWVEGAFTKTKIALKNKTFELQEFYDRYMSGEGRNYYEYLISTTVKETLTIEEDSKAREMVYAFKNNKYTGSYFTFNPDTTNVFQLEIFWEYNEVLMKSRLDILSLNHKDKTIEVIDIKTTEYTSQFEFIFWKHRYDFQASAYLLAVQWLIDNHSEFVEFKDYTILPFKWLVQGTKYPGTPVVYTCSEKTKGIGRDGGIKDNRHYCGFSSAVDKLKFHLLHDMWDYPMEVYLNEGNLEI